MTNFERIKNSTEEELANILADEMGHGDCYDCPNMYRCGTSCRSAWLEWLHDESQASEEKDK